jgi:ABC-type dipeptide/oligopeptide/nickel transport system permease component
MFALPGDAAQLEAGPNASPETIATIRAALGLDLPLWQQTLNYLVGLLHGDLGISTRSRQPIRLELAGVLGPTITLALVTEFVAALIGILLGTAAALSRRKWVAPVILAGSAVSLCLPLFAIGLVLQLIFALWLKVLPPSGGGGLLSAAIVLPVLTCVIPSAGFLVRFVKTALEEHAAEDFVRTALANGLGRRRVIVGQVLRSSLTPIIAIVTNDLARLLGGIALVEVIFARPGVGKYAFDALQTRDLPALEGSVLVISLAVLILNTLAETCYAAADRRSTPVRTG